MIAAWIVVERNLLSYRRTPAVLLSAMFEPFIFLFGLGIGLGKLIDTVEWHGEPIEYAAFVAPGLIAVSAMNGALFEMSFNFYFKLRESRTYDAMLVTPLGLRSVLDGELSWAMIRGGLYSVVFLAALAAFGYLESWWALLIPLAALLIGLSFASIASWATTFVRGWQDFDLFFLATQPLFVLSTTFFAIDVYPDWAHPIVYATPLYHGVDLVRDLARGTVAWSSFGNIAYLLVMAGVGRALATRRSAELLTT